ncbi:MAG: hypothetical protein KF878_09265 [Planctomycetes bacterium]|nr:hypothetical protein [Planctomycetota bacterium]
MMRRRLLLLAVALAGCASAPPAAPEAPAAPAVTVDPWLAPDAGLVAAFGARFEAQSGAPACQAALVRDEPEHAHALFLQADADATLEALADAFARQRPPQVAYLDSLRARRSAPAAHARGRAAVGRALALRAADRPGRGRLRRAGRGFAEVRDPVWSAEVRLVEAALGAPLPGAFVGTAVQRTQALFFSSAADPEAVVAEWGAATRRDDGVTWHATALERLEALRQEREASAAAPPAWLRALSRAALERRLPLVALRHAATLQRSAPVPPAGDRLLLARAHHLAAQAEPALAEGQRAVEDARAARDLVTEASARALVAELLVDLGRVDAAAEEFAAAERLFLEAGDPAGRLRQAVNRAGVLLRARRLDDAEAALAPVRGLSLPGEAGADLACRRDVTVALLELAAGRAGADEVARRAEQALQVARAAGAYHAVERFEGLPRRLRSPGG